MKTSRMSEMYTKKVRPELQKKLGLKNVMEVPKISKIVLNVGVKDAVADSRSLQIAAQILGDIAGQLPVRTLAKKSIATFKIREGMPIGVMVTLRRNEMYAFLDKLINLALPKVRDFHGVSKKLDGQGNYNLGIKEWSIFPEAEGVALEKNYGLNVSIHTTAQTDEAARELLVSFGMPFKKS